MGAYMRRRALGQPVRIPAEFRELNRIGVNLNQMARVLNSGAVPVSAKTLAAASLGEGTPASGAFTVSVAR